MLNKANLIGGGLIQGKNDYGDDNFTFYGLYFAPKIKYVLAIDKNGLSHEHKTLKGFNDGERLLDRSQYFKKMRSCLKAGKNCLIVALS